MPAFPSGFPSATVLLAAQMAVDQVLGNAGSQLKAWRGSGTSVLLCSWRLPCYKALFFSCRSLSHWQSLLSKVLGKLHPWEGAGSCRGAAGTLLTWVKRLSLHASSSSASCVSSLLLYLFSLCSVPGSNCGSDSSSTLRG